MLSNHVYIYMLNLFAQVHDIKQGYYVLQLSAVYINVLQPQLLRNNK